MAEGEAVDQSFGQHFDRLSQFVRFAEGLSTLRAQRAQDEGGAPLLRHWAKRYEEALTPGPSPLRGRGELDGEVAGRAEAPQLLH